MIKKTAKLLVGIAIVAVPLVSIHAQTPVKYNVKEKVNVDYVHGQLPSTMGVHNIQTMRANRELPAQSEGYGWTYNHGANIAYWNGKIYINYLSDPIGEHMAPGQTYMQSSADGYTWSFPQVVFPIYRIPDGTKKEGNHLVAEDLDAVMHQRMGFYLDKESNRFFTLGFYGVCLNEEDKPNDGKGIGRVIREIKKDYSLGDIYFIRYNENWNESNTSFPLYTSSKDKEFVAVCEKMLNDPLVTLQWKEETSRNDEIIPKISGKGKAFCYYTLDDSRVIGMFKSAESGVSADGGKTWEMGITPGLFTTSSKMWGEKTSDGNYAQVYNPSMYRWPMAISTSKDGLNYENVSLVHDEISPMRYSGREKSYGPQYLRGILPGNGTVPDKNMWLAYSVNKEDIWVARVTVPVLTKATNHVDEDFSQIEKLNDLTRWNIYSPVWAPVSITKVANGKTALRLEDKDPYDFAKVEHLFPGTENVEMSTTVIPEQNSNGRLCIELQNQKNNYGVRLNFDPDGMIRSKRSYKYRDLVRYEANKSYDIKITTDAEKQMYTVWINGKEEKTEYFTAPMEEFTKVVFRTGLSFHVPTADTPPHIEEDLNKPGVADNIAAFKIVKVKTSGK